MKTTNYTLLLYFFLGFMGVVNAQATTYSIRFWGSADYIHVPNCQQAQLTGDMTIMFDTRIKSTTSLKSLICMGDDTSSVMTNNDLYKVELLPGGSQIRYSHEYGSGSLEQVTFNWSVIVDQWTNIAIVRDNTAKTLDLYIEGTLVETKSYVNPPQGGNLDQLSFGHTLGAIGDFNNGLLDNISIWDAAMDDQTVFLYAGCLPSGNDTNLVAYYNFDEGTGILVNDLVNGNNGLLYGTSLNWRTQHRFYGCTVGIPELENTNQDREIIKVYDLMGRETVIEPNKLLILLYDDGSTQKVFHTE